MPDLCSVIRGARRQAPAARMIGEFAVKHGLRVVGTRLGGIVATMYPAQSPPTRDRSSQEPFPGPTRTGVATSSAEAAAATRVSMTEPFPGYDSYTARQILERFEGLNAEERAVVREYESRHRRRETILSILGGDKRSGSEMHASADVPGNP